MFWSLLQQVGGKGISFIVVIILARLLTPEIFGLIGMLMIFIQLSQVLVRAGFNQALIQKKEVDEEDYSSVFWINLVVSLLIYGILYISAPFIAEFYDQPILVKLTRVLTLIFVINAFSYVQQARLQKEMQFKTLTIIHIPSVIIGGVAGIVMAIKGFGVWSIIAQRLITRFIYTIQIWFYARWKPMLSFNATKAKQLFSFGGRLMLTSILNVVYNNIYLVVIGKFYSVSMVGLYQQSYNLVEKPSATLSGAVNKVAFPAFSSIQNEDEKLKIGYKKITQQVLYWLCPIFVFSGVLAVPLFRFVLTEKWLPAVPYFRCLCIVGILYPLNIFSVNILKVKGRSDIYLKLAIIKKAFITIGLFFAIPFSIWALLILQSTYYVFAFILNSYFAGQFLKYPVKEQIIDILPILLLTLVTGVVIFFIDQFLSFLPDFMRLMLGFVIGGGLYWIIAKYKNFDPYQDISEIYEENAKNMLSFKKWF